MSGNEGFVKVSCCILSYNNAHFLPAAIESVIQQDYTNIQIVLCDDGSKEFPDSIYELLLNSGREYEVIRNKTNLGIVKNVNNGCKKAKGDIILTLAADDVLYSNAVVSAIVKKQKETGDEFFACRRLLCQKGTMKPIALIPTDKEIKRIQKLDTPEKQFVALATKEFMHMASGCCMCYTKKKLEEIGYFDEDYRLVEDAPFLLKYMVKGNLVKTHYEVISIKYQDGGISNSVIPKDSHIFRDGSRMYTKDIFPYMDKLDFFTRRIIRCIYDFRMLESKKDRITYILFHPDFLYWKIQSKVRAQLLK